MATKKTAKKKAKPKASSKKNADYRLPPKGAPAALVQLSEAYVAYARTMPEAWEDHPWGERAIKVKKKIFAFASWYDDGFNMTLKLPLSGELVLELPAASPTGYGLGKSGWVSLRFVDDKALPPLEMVKGWTRESYRAVAPKTLARQVVG